MNIGTCIFYVNVWLSYDRWLGMESLGQSLETQNNIGSHLGETDILINLGFSFSIWS